MVERFCSLDQTHLACESTLEEIMQFRRPKLNKKKRSSPQFGTRFGRNLKNLFVLAGSFSSDHSALKSRWGNAKSCWGDANSQWGMRPPYNLSTGWLKNFLPSPAYKVKSSSYIHLFLKPYYLPHIKLPFRKLSSYCRIYS